MKILFLDDNPIRHSRFRERFIGLDVTHVHTHDEAIEALKKYHFDEVWLDHDLSEAASMGKAAPHEKTGYDVACFIATMPKKPGGVVIHSMNPVGASRMEAVLSDAGIRTVRTFV